jgi:hypothetical protein
MLKTSGSRSVAISSTVRSNDPAQEVGGDPYRGGPACLVDSRSHRALVGRTFATTSALP